MALGKRTKIVIVVAVLTAVAVALWGPLKSWLAPAEAGRTLPLSGTLMASIKRGQLQPWSPRKIAWV